MKIDIFNHVMPMLYLDMMKRHLKDQGMLKRMSNLRMLWDIEARVQMLDEKFPDVQQVLTLSLPSPELMGGPELSPELARIANDGMAGMVAKWPKKFPAFVASLPMNNVPAALEVMDRAIGKIEARGVAEHPRRLRERTEVEIRDLAGARVAVRDERRHGAHGVLGVLREASRVAHHHPPLRRHDPVFFGPSRDALGAARQPQRRRELRGSAQAHVEEADRVLPHVLRGHGARRLGPGAALRAGFLRRRPRGVRERLPLRSRGRADVHPRGNPLGRGPQAAGSRQAQDLLWKCDETAEDANRAEEIAPKKGPNGPFFVSAENPYLTVAAPALQTTSSCEPVPPEQPMAPISFPPSRSGIPPREPITPSSVMR